MLNINHIDRIGKSGFPICDDCLIPMVPMTTTRLTDPDQLKLMGKLLDALEDNDGFVSTR